MAAEYQCETCGAKYWRNGPGPCFADGCIGHLKRVIKPRVMKRCEICGKAFVVNAAGQRACPGECTARLREKEGRALSLDAFRRAEEEKKRQKRLRGAYGECWEYKSPLTNKRKCHNPKCNTKTWDYYCDVCRGKMMVKEGSSGLNGEAELFSGGVIDGGIR